MPMQMSASTAGYVVLAIVVLWVIVTFFSVVVAGVKPPDCNPSNLIECFKAPLELASKIFNFGVSI